MKAMYQDNLSFVKSCFGSMQNFLKVRHENLKTTAILWIPLSPRLDSFGELQKPGTPILVFLN
jgi:hypothetical protein